MEKKQVLSELNNLILEGENKVLKSKFSNQISMGERVNAALYIGWYTKSFSFLETILPKDNAFIEKYAKLEKNYYYMALSCIGILKNVIEYIEKDILIISQTQQDYYAKEGLTIIFSKFHRIVHQLRNRYNNRCTIDVEDEYDVQDLLHALLKLYFDDIRAEEWTPSYAGKSARMDFLLRKERVVIEVKKTRKGLADKEIGDQLIVDIERYKSHPDCSKLICFVYDPEGRIGNPDGLINDLNNQHQGFVKVIIEPKI